MASSTITRFVLISLLSQTVQADTQSDYPAPPGAYGQQNILKNSHLNLGKGAPYVIIEGQANSEPPAAKPLANKPLPDIRPDKNNHQAANRSSPYPLIFLPSTQSPPETIELKSDNDINVFPAGDPDQTLPPAPADYVEEGKNYPSARQLDAQYQHAKKLPFDQWGQEPAQPPSNPIDFQVAPDISQYDYPRPNRYYQGTGRSNFLSSYPALNSAPYSDQYSAQTNPAYLHQPYSDQYQNRYRDNFGNNTDLLYGRKLAIDALMPPANLDLQHFEQFPVPQDVYGNSPAYTQPSGSADYFRQIPEEEIIYPPNYPGLR